MTAPLSVKKAFFRRNAINLGVALAVICLTIGSSIATEFDYSTMLSSFPKAMTWLFSNFVPDARAIRNLPNILGKLGETVLVSIMATVVASFMALVLALLASRTTRPHPAVSLVIRFFASLCRNIPVVAWAMIFLLSFGQNVFTGFLALFVGTVGFLTRAYTETIDETAESSVEALKASGAPWLSTISQAVIPNVMPQIASWMLYMIETNIRDATLVGILTGTGIGFLFQLYYQSMRFPSAGMVIISIILVVVAIETISNALRRIIL